MPELIAQWISGIVSTVGGFAGDPVGAIMGWIGSVLEALAELAARVLELLPEAEDLNLDIPSGWLVGYSWLNSFLPLSEAMTALGLLAVAAGVVVTVRVAIIAYHLIPKPGIGT